jgi:hypothetical protein
MSTETQLVAPDQLLVVEVMMKQPTGGLEAQDCTAVSRPELW